MPNVYRELTTTRVLVMEWVNGVSAYQRDRIEEMGLDTVAVAGALLHCCLHQMLVNGHFQADRTRATSLSKRTVRLPLSTSARPAAWTRCNSQPFAR